MLHTQWKEIFRDHPLRLTLGELPLVDGQSGSFKQQIDVEIAAFKQRWDWVMQPLVNPVALEVIVSTSASVPKDLDNIVREYLLPKFVPSFGTVTDYTFTADFEELAKRDANILMKWGPTPPKSTRDGVTRYEVWRLPPAPPGTSGFVSVALVVDDGRRRSAFHQIDDELTRWAVKVESADC